MNIILASSSPRRRQQLQQIGIDFKIMVPNVDETPLNNEVAANLVERLAFEKATAVGENCKNALIIAGDQVGVNEEIILGKPHSEANAITQLMAASGKTLRFYSGLCVLNTMTAHRDICTVTTDVTFRHLNLIEITSYIRREKPLKCAGSFNIDGLGITLFKRIESNDPSALLGLPLIQLTTFLRQHQIDIP